MTAKPPTWVEASEVRLVVVRADRSPVDRPSAWVVVMAPNCVVDSEAKVVVLSAVTWVAVKPGILVEVMPLAWPADSAPTDAADKAPSCVVLSVPTWVEVRPPN